ncbi:MAG: ZIP family metal transporter [Clostridiales bacterium]|nr:ZIP family metal transporter [Clostridiales bacterium]
MLIVLWTALGVGGATAVGALIGFLFKNPSHKFNDVILSFAAGIMLCAAVMGLIVPSLEYGSGGWPVLITVVGIFIGAVVLYLIDKCVPHLHKFSGIGEEKHPNRSKNASKVLLFVLAIAIHNFPEGIATGVSFGTGNTADALTVAGGIALQNIPEGMVIIAPMVAAGISKKRTLFIALMTGVVEIIGTFIGYFAVSVSTIILPFALAFAGGTMLYIISDEMIPETHAHGNERASTFTLLIGFCVMLAVDFFLG